MSIDFQSKGSAFKRQLLAEIRDMTITLLNGFSATIVAQQEGTAVSDGHRALNFQGAGVTVSDEPLQRRVNVLISGTRLSGSATEIHSTTGAERVFDAGVNGASAPASWQTTGYNDAVTGWSNSITYQSTLLFTNAQLVAKASGNQTDYNVWLYRRHFTLPAGTPSAASLQVFGDGPIQAVYMNGTQISSGFPAGSATISVPISTLNMGGADNVLAIRDGNDPGATPNPMQIAYRMDLNYGVEAASSITVEELDGAPLVLAKTLRFPNGSLTDDGGGQVTYTPPGGGTSITIEEVDGAPLVAASTLRFPNGTLTDDGGGQVTYTPTSFSLPSPVTNALGSDVTCTNANQYYDGPSVTIGAGTWRLSGSVTVYNAAAGGTFNWTAKLWNGTTVYASTQATQTNNSYVVSLSLSWVITVASSTTVKISAACSTAGGLIKAAALNNGAGNNASTLSASAA